MEGKSYRLVSCLFFYASSIDQLDKDLERK